ncbi:hypothetical protein B2J93_6346 [Marssonina coronariae]|uniref:Uncharacterized protein n=1 Tax=Diplocarpon coronariae TaxID=2795749 RepID=A0A218Z0M8_9HELO|nr:hypothetical protein B2J93_6346 [Marssonina coronariae]
MAPALPAQRAPAAREEHGRTPKRTRRAARSLRASFVLGDRGDAPRTREAQPGGKTREGCTSGDSGCARKTRVPGPVSDVCDGTYCARRERGEQYVAAPPPPLPPPPAPPATRADVTTSDEGLEEDGDPWHLDTPPWREFSSGRSRGLERGVQSERQHVRSRDTGPSRAVRRSTHPCLRPPVISPSPPVYYPPPVIPTKCAVQDQDARVVWTLGELRWRPVPKADCWPGLLRGERRKGIGLRVPPSLRKVWELARRCWATALPSDFRAAHLADSIPRRSPEMAVIQIDPAGRGRAGSVCSGL